VLLLNLKVIGQASPTMNVNDCVVSFSLYLGDNCPAEYGSRAWAFHHRWGLERINLLMVPSTPRW